MVFTLCLKVFMPPCILYRCSVCFFNTDKKTDVILIKKRKPCIVSNISIVAISVGLPVTVNNPVPVSQVRFQQFRAI